MTGKDELIDLLPKFKNRVRVATWGQNVKAILNEVTKAHQEYETDYDLIYPFFDTGNLYSTCKGLWEFCKYNLKYSIEGEDEQSVKSPAAILQPGQKIDCKHYALFIAGVLDAIKQNEGDEFEWFYRFVSDKPDKIIGHVFVVAVELGGTEYDIDPVLSSFNEKCNWTKIKDALVMPVYSISGIKKSVGALPAISIDLNKQQAESNFLVMVNRNDFGLKTLLNSDHETLYGRVRQWYTANGFDFNHLIVILGQ